MSLRTRLTVDRGGDRGGGGGRRRVRGAGQRDERAARRDRQVPARAGREHRAASARWPSAATSAARHTHDADDDHGPLLRVRRGAADHRPQRARSRTRCRASRRSRSTPRTAPSRRGRSSSRYRDVTVGGEQYRMITASLRDGGAVQIARPGVGDRRRARRAAHPAGADRAGRASRSPRWRRGW